MSAKANWLTSNVLARTHGSAEPGVRREVKRLLARQSRRNGEKGLALLLDSLTSEATALPGEEQTFPADRVQLPDTRRFGRDMLSLEELLDEEAWDDEKLPLELKGGLPDWMLDQSMRSGGDAMQHLAMHEVRDSRSVRARVLLDEDEETFA